MISIFYKQLLCFASVLLFVTSLSFADSAPIKFGKPDIEDLKMSVYEPDSSADAVILCSYGYFDASQYRFINTLRIKILKKSGTSWGTRVFNTIGSDVSVRGITFNLEGDEVVETKVKNESILKKRIINSLYSVTVAMPNVKVGSVLDIEIVSNGLPREWLFQELIPVKYSELLVESSPYIDFQRNFFGYLSFDLSTGDHWIMSNIPAFKIEPYMDSYKNYISKVEFDLRSVHIPGYYEDFASNWEQVAGTLIDSEDFGGILKSRAGYLNDWEEEINETCETEEEKLKAAFEKVKSVKWNDECNVVVSTTALGSVFKDKLGNSAEINLILIKLLEKLGFKVYPIVLSTRSNGQLSYIFPSLNKLNYILCGLSLNDKLVVLDATDQRLPLGLLPERAINDHGRIIFSKEKTEWVKLDPEKKDVERVFLQVKLNPDNTLSGKRAVKYDDYGAYEKRKELESFNSDKDYITDRESDFNGLKISDIEVTGKEDVYDRLQETWTITLSDQVEEIDDLLMINLNFFDRVTENPFKLEERLYPVNYPYCSDRQSTVVFEVPDGYEVSELPQPMVIALPENGGKFMINYSKQGNSIATSCKITIDKSVFLPEEYPYLREFYTQIVKKQAEPIILKKTI